jgi:NADH-quinone oxidoreductase subunit L
MHALASLFPNDQFGLLGLIIALPLLGAIVNGVWGRRLGREAVTTMALTVMGLAFLTAVVTFLHLREVAHEAGHGSHVKLSWTAWEWFHTSGGRSAHTIPIDLKFSVDQLSGIMMLVITGIGFLIHLYSSSYMAEDASFSRFFAYLNLFVTAMLILVLGDNLVVLFIGWEGVGLCSYLLIGFWFGKLENAAAGRKAFIANRIGDFGLIIGMFLLVQYTGALDWEGIARNAQQLLAPSAAARVHLWPVGGGVYQGFWSFLQPAHPLTISAATAASLALFLGCTGKSAQLPLYVWLPDAMAGPTPVSALIHAATMVTAGVYLICRLNFVFVLSPFTMTVIAVVGALTALFAATIALVQNDVKKVLAYSTVSQLGFMFLGVGVGAFTAGFFHVFTHAFFKACLFLGAGSVIHAMHAHIHDDVASQDMRNMGGLKKYMPITFATFAVSTLAIIGTPLTSGFFSKDEILFKAFTSHAIHPFKEKLAQRGVGVWEQPTWIGPALYVVGVIAATMTAFYMCRALFLTFFGEFKGWEIGEAAHAHHGEHGHHDHAHDDHGHGHHGPAPAPHESPWQMTLPLVILAVGALFGGWLNAAPFHFEPLGEWLEPVFDHAVKAAVEARGGEEHAHHLMWPLAAGGVAAFAIGSSIAYWMYLAQKGEPAKKLAESNKGLHQLLLDKWRVDELYGATVLGVTEATAETCAAVDQGIVDGLLARATSGAVAAGGFVLRSLHTGLFHAYGAAMVLGMVGVGWFFVAPHADVSVNEKSGTYTVQAAPGLGYAYRWDADGDGKFDTERFGEQRSVALSVEPGKTKQVRLEVKNAFGLTGSATVTVGTEAKKGATVVGLR